MDRLFLLRLLFIVTVNFFFHAVIDGLAEFTYHPSESSWGDPFYAGWHIFVYASELVFAVWILRKDLRYFWGMVAAVGFDLWDWSTARPLSKFFEIELPGVHYMADAVVNNLLFWAPDLKFEPAAALVEIGFLVALTVSWLYLERNRPLPGKQFRGTLMGLVSLILAMGLWRLLTLV